MKKTVKKTLLVVVATALATLFVTAASWSLPSSDTSRHDPQHKITALAKMLELTEEQEVSVQMLLTTSLEESEVENERLHVLREQLRGQPDQFDAATVQTAADEIGQITSRMVYRMASTRAEIYRLLDDEQKVAMDKMSEWSGKRGDKRRGHHRIPF